MGAVVLATATVTLLLAVPPLRGVAHQISGMNPGWIAAAMVLEVASCAAYVVIFRLFFAEVPAGLARRLAWAEEASGALLPTGGLGALAVGGWLLRQAGMSTRRVVESSSALFFLTSGMNVAALVVGGAVGYLGFDIAALGPLFAATGDAIPVDTLVLGYVIGYIANVLPVPGGFGVLEGGLAGMLIAYGAPPTRGAAAVVVYHAIAFWIPSLGGLVGYALLLRREARETHLQTPRRDSSTPRSCLPPRHRRHEVTGEPRQGPRTAVGGTRGR
ncbi:MAG: YbhN family protein [Solirubrobacteraceae bacterium]